ncbi:2TM domain-containing protein [uncultured Lacinutrix sp.]|uniref:2TM domain-containing protein n=1 Tax=uncultured Lacinutrix sp. TaxID=574032 RepID=UPI002624CEE9|nr:2TM domain-containing protein [uncultured Lacinutrix sp.]
MNKLVKEIVITFIVGTLVFIVGTVFFEDYEHKSTQAYLITFAFYQLYAFVLGFSNTRYFAFLERRQWKEKEGIKRIVIGIIGSVLITLIGLFLLRTFTYIIYLDYSFNEFIANERFEYYQFGLWITMTIVIIFHVIYFYNRYQKNKIKEQKVIAGTASAKFDALKNQLDPHFLFNSLNVLTSLIEENPDSAQKFTTSLSKVYRYVLEQKNKDLVTVDEELQFAKTYMSLLKMRFEDSIVFDIPEHASNPDSKVVPLSLQLLLENAVKHNIVTANKPLHIKIYERDGQLIVENNLQTKQVVKKSSGVGLDNIRQRYKLLTNRQVSIIEDKTNFKVSIPMLTKQITIMRQLPEKQFDDSYVRARKHVEELKGFYYNVISYCFVIPFLIFINYRTYWEFKWFWFSAIGWGIGIAFHAYKVFVNDGILGRDWEKRKIEKFMEEEQNNRYK